jgi:hypothetical protein
LPKEIALQVQAIMEEEERTASDVLRRLIKAGLGARKDTALTFNQYIARRCTAGAPINDDREAFYFYLRGLGNHSCPVSAWDTWWDRFVQWQDAYDESETLADALR